MLNISEILSRSELERIHELIPQATVVDGRATADGMAANVKSNVLLQLDGDPIEAMVVEALARSALFGSYVIPMRFAPPMVCRYEAGMTYGPHIDAPIMGESPPMRCDVAITVFLSDPASYDGGDLVVSSHVAEVGVKLPAGAAFVYPAGSLHRVEPVTRGERLVVVTWAQSFVRDGEIREMLFDLDRGVRALGELEGTAELVKLFTKTRANLYRRHAEV